MDAVEMTGTERIAPADAVEVDGRRLVGRVEELRRIGATEEGGVTRLAFGPEDRAARERVTEYLWEAGLVPEVDPAGNIVGREPGADPDVPVLVLGSHIDTVPDGGAYDGALGVLAAIEVAHTARERGLALHRPLVVTVFADEEGTNRTPGMWGSHAVAGTLTDAHAASSDALGRSMESLVAGVGGDVKRIASAAWPPGAIEAFLELHIEQGPVLDRTGPDIGIVEAVTGRVSVDVEVVGHANHAGTTPMGLRRDALVTAAHVVIAVEALAGTHGIVRAATVGDCVVEPGAWNVVPGRARLRVDLRDIDPRALDAAVAALRKRARELAARTDTTIHVTPVDRVEPVPCDPRLRRLLTDACGDLGLSCVPMPSGAGHDAQIIASIAPMGMVFVPSVDGVSHAPAERTESRDVVNGANVLLRAVTSYRGLSPVPFGDGAIARR